jgi:serine/threonine-protein kinase RsbW
MGRRDCLSIRSDPALFGEARRWLSGIALREGFTENAVRELCLALNEACASAHRHSYGGRVDGQVELEVEIAEGVLRLTVRDFGASFEPSHYEPPREPGRGLGGYGVPLMRSVMDEVDYRRTSVGTCVVLVKRKNGPSGGSGEASG